MNSEGTGLEVVLDASALIAVQNPADSCHDSALAILDELADRPWLVHPLTHVEFLVGPARASGARGIREANDWLDLCGVQVADNMEEGDLRHADSRRSLALLRATTQLKLPDVVVLYLAVARTGTLVTGDRRLARAARDQQVPVEELQAST